jgi:serine protease Do
MFRGFLFVVVAACLGLPLSAFEPQPEKPQIILKRGGSFLGIGVSELNSERMKALNLREERGVEVTRVEDEGPAAKGGMKVGDVILEYNGQRVEGTEQLLRLVSETPPGREVKIGVSRAGSLQTLTVRTGSKKAWIAKHGDQMRIELPEMPELMVPDVPKAFMTWRSAALGIEAESVEGQLAEFFGVKEGVLVRSVAKGSAAERAGIKAGDVIIKVDTTVVASPKEVTQALRSNKGRKDVPLRVVREKREISISVSLDEDRTP